MAVIGWQSLFAPVAFSHYAHGWPQRAHKPTQMMKGFMRIICVILCLIISTSVPAYAGSILWAAKHSSTNLIKDEEWLADALLTEEQDADPPAEDAEASSLETIDNPELGEEAEGMELQDIPKTGEDTLAEPLMEDIVDYISATPGEPETAMDDPVPDDVIDKTGENQSS